MKGVIYCYHCIPTGKKYIGQTVNEKRRKWRHKHDCKNGVDYKFYRAVRKYGWENFIYGVIEEYDVDFLGEQEEFFIAKYDSYDNGYNSTTGGEGVRGFIPSEETRKKMSESAKNRGCNNRKYFTEEEKREVKRKRDREYQQRIKERRKEYMKEWREKNLDYLKEYKEKNKERDKIRWKKNREKNKNKRSEYGKWYYHNVVKPLKQVAQQSREEQN
jgi:group I intron endonuclease